MRTSWFPFLMILLELALSWPCPSSGASRRTYYHTNMHLRERLNKMSIIGDSPLGEHLALQMLLDRHPMGHGSGRHSPTSELAESILRARDRSESIEDSNLEARKLMAEHYLGLDFRDWFELGQERFKRYFGRSNIGERNRIWNTNFNQGNDGPSSIDHARNAIIPRSWNELEALVDPTHEQLSVTEPAHATLHTSLPDISMRLPPIALSEASNLLIPKVGSTAEVILYHPGMRAVRLRTVPISHGPSGHAIHYRIPKKYLQADGKYFHLDFLPLFIRVEINGLKQTFRFNVPLESRF